MSTPAPSGPKISAQRSMFDIHVFTDVTVALPAAHTVGPVLLDGDARDERAEFSTPQPTITTSSAADGTAARQSTP